MQWLGEDKLLGFRFATCFMSYGLITRNVTARTDKCLAELFPESARERVIPMTLGAIRDCAQAGSARGKALDVKTIEQVVERFGDDTPSYIPWIVVGEDKSR